MKSLLKSGSWDRGPRADGSFQLKRRDDLTGLHIIYHPSCIFFLKALYTSFNTIQQEKLDTNHLPRFEPVFFLFAFVFSNQTFQRRSRLGALRRLRGAGFLRSLGFCPGWRLFRGAGTLVCHSLKKSNHFNGNRFFF